MWKRLRFAGWVIFHPFDGFWDLKREHIGTVRSATLLVAALIVTNIFKSQFVGFVIEPDAGPVRVFSEVLMVFFPLLLWCTANWCITTLVEGEGSFTDIYITTAYALTPMLLANLPLLLLGNVIVKHELQVYNLLEGIVLLWVVFLLFTGIMTVHQFSVGKTLFTVIVALLGMAIILFLLLLFYSLVQQMFRFFYLAFNEASLRFS